MKRKNAALAAVSLARLAFMGCALVGGYSEASCAAPMIEVEPSRAAPAGAFRVPGEAFGRGCGDVGPVLEDLMQRVTRPLVVGTVRRLKNVLEDGLGRTQSRRVRRFHAVDQTEASPRVTRRTAKP